LATAEFVHLHGHSEYSLLDGGCAVGKMAELASEYDMPALAITDHGNLFGAIAHYKACAAAGIKPIIGSEVYVSVGSRHLRKPARELQHASNHLVLLAKNHVGYKNLIKLVSKGFLEGYYYNPRVDKEILREYSEGLICLSACVSGEIAHLIQREGLTAAEEAAEEFRDIFGDDYFLEIQRHGIDIEEKVNDGLMRLHQKMGIPLVATNDFHFLSADDHSAHDALVCIQTGKNIADKNRMCYPTGLYMKTAAEMQSLFRDLPNALESTVEIAGRCDLEIEFGQMILPEFELPEGKPDAFVYLTELANEGLRRRYGRIDEVLQQRIDYELGIIRETGFVDYFLIVWDYVHFARNSGMTVGPGRGSGAGSLVAYSLQITDTDPIGHNLLFERFLNPERVSPPDFDIDFADRDKIVQYVVQKYGEGNVCQIITFGTMGAKAVIRDVGRVLGMPFGEVDAIAKLVPTELKMTLDKAIERVPELKQASEASDERGLLMTHARKLEGLARHASVHAAGVIIAPSDLTEFMPLYRSPKDGRILTQWDGPTCEEIGFMKMDFLGLNELVLMDEAVRLIRIQEPGFSIEAIPWDDRVTLDLFGRGETVGVFQFESGGMREYLSQLKPDKLSDIIAMNALYRPGPMEQIPNYIARKNGEQEITYLHPSLDTILEETYGVIVYQEQVLQIAQRLAGFTLGSADILRRAMGKKKPEEMAKQKKAFIEGCIANDVDRKIAEQLFSEIDVFSGYGFNKCHAAPYAELAYKNAYLKANYPGEYMAASMTTSMGNSDNVKILLDECRRMSIPVLPPNVNESAGNFIPTLEGVRFGLAAVKNVGPGAAQAIVDERAQGGRFTDLFDLCERIDLKAVNRRVIESLISSGGLDTLEGHRAQMLEGLDLALKSAQQVQQQRERGQISLFDLAGDDAGSSAVERLSLPLLEEWSEGQKLAHERELLGFYVSSHPLDPFQRDLAYFTVSLGEIQEQEEGTQLRVGGLVGRVSTATDRKGNPIAFVTLEDKMDQSDIVFFSDAYGKHRDLIHQDQPLLIEGRLSRRNGTGSVQVESAMLLSQARERLTRALHISLVADQIAPDMLQQLKTVCQGYSGRCELVIHLPNGGDVDTVVRSRSIQVDPCDELLRQLGEVVKGGRSWLVPEPMVFQSYPRKRSF